MNGRGTLRLMRMVEFNLWKEIGLPSVLESKTLRLEDSKYLESQEGVSDKCTIA